MGYKNQNTVVQGFIEFLYNRGNIKIRNENII